MSDAKELTPAQLAALIALGINDATSKATAALRALVRLGLAAEEKRHEAPSLFVLTEDGEALFESLSRKEIAQQTHFRQALNDGGWFDLTQAQCWAEEEEEASEKGRSNLWLTGKGQWVLQRLDTKHWRRITELEACAWWLRHREHCPVPPELEATFAATEV